LSWDSTSVVCDLTEMPTSPTWLYVQLGGMAELSGCEFSLLWQPTGPLGTGCYEFLAGEHPSGNGDDCTWMMRGSQVEGMNMHGEAHWNLSFVVDECSTCQTGNVARMLIQFGSCAWGAAGRFCFQYVKFSDCASVVHHATIVGSATVLSGSDVYCPCGPIGAPLCPDCHWAVPVEGSTWGAVKALYK